METEKSRNSVNIRFAKYVSQNVLAMLGISCYILADTYFISVAAGTDGMAALNLVLPIYSLMFAIGAMLGMGHATRYAILKAQGDSSSERYFFNALIFALIIGAVFMLIGGLFPEKVLAVMGGDESIIAVGRSYTRTFMLFAPFFILNHIFNAFVRNDGSPSLSMTATLVGSFANIILDYVFMFPMHMGMMGAALATGLSPVISTAINSSHFFSRKNGIPVKAGMPSAKILFRSSQLGVAAFVGEISSAVTTVVFNFIILDLAGNTGVAAYGVIANFALVAMAVFNGISQGSQPLVSSFYGKGEYDNTAKVLKLSLITAVSAAVIIIAVMSAAAEPFTAVFNSEGSAEMAECAVRGLKIYVWGFIFAGINVVGTGYLSAADRAAPAFRASISRGFAAIILFAFLLSSLLKMTGVWLAFPAAELFTVFLTVPSIIRSGKEDNKA